MNVPKMTAQELREMVGDVEIPPDSKPPYWDYWRCDLRNCILTDKPENFTRWPTIRHTMLMNHLPVDGSWQIVSKNLKRFKHAMSPPSVGEPDWYNGYSRVMVEQAAHIAQWERNSGKTIDELDSIMEFGGGYGAMALLVYRLGFRGKYIIYDLPEMAYFQKWFLSQHGVAVQHYTSIESIPGVEKREVYHADMLIAIDSISETPMDLRKRFFSRTAMENFIFRYSPIWEKYDNAQYFVEFMDKRKEVLWYSWEAKGWVSTSLVGW